MIFRRTDKYGYSRYYGGGGPAFVIKVVVTIALMVALVIGAAAFVVQKYMVYTENGGHLELPWEKKATQQGDEDPGLDDLIVTGEDSSQSAEESGEASQSAEESTETGAEASADASQSTESSAEASADASQSAEASESGDTSAPAEEPQSGWWERFVAWLKGIFAPAQTTSQPQSDSSAAADASQSAEAESSGGLWPFHSGKQEEESSQQAAEESSAQPEPEKKEPLSDGLLIQHVSMGDLKQNYAEGDIKNKSGNGLMLFMKESGGKLNFRSNTGLAGELAVNGDESTHSKVKEVVSDLNAKDYYTLAYVDGFQDQKAPELEKRLYDGGGSAWYDGEDRAWADPASESYQSYLISLVKELEDMGFDEIVLNNACYPRTGNTSILSSECYNPDSFRETVGGFYEKLAKETKGSKSLISLITTETAIEEGYDAATGQSLEDMLQLGGRLWVETERSRAQSLSAKLSQAGYADNALGVLVSSLSADENCNQMNLD